MYELTHERGYIDTQTNVYGLTHAQTQKTYRERERERERERGRDVA